MQVRGDVVEEDTVAPVVAGEGHAEGERGDRGEDGLLEGVKFKLDLKWGGLSFPV